MSLQELCAFSRSRRFLMVVVYTNPQSVFCSIPQVFLQVEVDKGEMTVLLKWSQIYNMSEMFICILFLTEIWVHFKCSVCIEHCMLWITNTPMSVLVLWDCILVLVVQCCGGTGVLLISIRRIIIIVPVAAIVKKYKTGKNNWIRYWCTSHEYAEKDKKNGEVQLKMR